MGWPQIVMIVLYTVNCVLSLILHGQNRTGKYNFFSALIGTGIGVWILGQGGFWR